MFDVSGSGPSRRWRLKSGNPVDPAVHEVPQAGQDAAGARTLAMSDPATVMSNQCRAFRPAPHRGTRPGGGIASDGPAGRAQPAARSSVSVGGSGSTAGRSGNRDGIHLPVPRAASPADVEDVALLSGRPGTRRRLATVIGVSSIVLAVAVVGNVAGWSGLADPLETRDSWSTDAPTRSGPAPSTSAAISPTTASQSSSAGSTSRRVSSPWICRRRWHQRQQRSHAWRPPCQVMATQHRQRHLPTRSVGMEQRHRMDGNVRQNQGTQNKHRCPAANVEKQRLY